MSFLTGIKKHLPTRRKIQKSIPGNIKTIRKPALWCFECDCVARGVAVGLFVAFLPIPFQMLIAVLLAIISRANLPIAVALTWVSNPLTFGPFTYLTYFVGTLITGENVATISIQDIPWSFHNISTLWTTFVTWLSQFGKVFFIGLPFVAIGSAIIGYLVIIICWQSNTLLRAWYKRKKSRK
ncbi:MAG: DUF2062 domain-containing protein [Gammaproteobacteria bacterium]